jgi:hypothetical protein
MGRFNIYLEQCEVTETYCFPAAMQLVCVQFGATTKQGLFFIIDRITGEQCGDDPAGNSIS